MSKVLAPVISSREALRLTMNEFDLTASVICAQAGLSDSSLSKFLSGNLDLKTQVLDKILSVVPPEAKQYYLSLLGYTEQTPLDASNRIFAIQQIRAFARNCTGDDFLDMLAAITEGRQESLRNV